MTPTPTAGEIWEWIGEDPAVLLLFGDKPRMADGYWQALNLTSGGLEDISINSANIVNWRLLA